MNWLSFQMTSSNFADEENGKTGAEGGYAGVFDRIMDSRIIPVLWGAVALESLTTDCTDEEDGKKWAVAEVAMRR